MDLTTAAAMATENTTGNTTGEIDLCADIFAIDQTFTFLYFFPLLLIVVLMSFFKTRKHLWKTCLKGRPGVLYPINFIDEFERRWMYTAVFLLLTYRILFLFDGKYFINFEIPRHIIFLKVFVTILNVIILCIEYYPLAACIVMRRSMIANVIGILLTLPWAFIILLRYAMCPPNEDKSLDHHITLDIINEIPLFFALGALLIGYGYDFYLNFRLYRKRKTACQSQNGSIAHKGGTVNTEQEELCLQYIRSLMKKPKPVQRTLTLKEKIKEKITYVQMTGFKYPPRVICTVTVGLYALYKTAVSVTLSAYFILDQISMTLDLLAPQLLGGNDTNGTLRTIGIYTDAVKWGFTACAITSFVIHVLLMLHFIMQYRSHIRMFFAGNHSWHHDFQYSPPNILVAGMRYSGYQVAFLLYGYMLMTLMLFLVLVIIVGFIILPLATKTRNAVANFLIDKLEHLWPAIIVGLAISFSQKLLAKYAFLQDQGAYVALDNRRLYHVTSFFLFFFNVVLGLFSCLKRILFSMIFGTLLISRLDRCLLMRGFEQFDSGFSAYLSMLTVDVYHNHPILKGFIHILQQEVQSHKEPKSVLIYNEEGEVESAVALNNIKKKRVRNKYWKIVTLMRNPTMVLERMRLNIEEARKNNEKDVAKMALDSIAGVGTVVLGGGLNNMDEKVHVL